MSKAPWTPNSWRNREAAQQPTWPDASALTAVEEQLSTLPPLVFAGEARSLTAALGQVAHGQSFLLQAGDCAESFADFRADAIRDKLKVILQMAVTLTYASGVPVVKVGRIAGQFAKPRSSSTETHGDVTLPAFRGHLVNGEAFTEEARQPDPQRLLQAYQHSVATLNLLRAFTKGGFAALNHVHAWNMSFVKDSPAGEAYEHVAQEIDRALRFMAACGIDLSTDANLDEVDFYTSHEALLLPYEEALTRQDSLSGDFIDTSAHMLWIGDRTRQLDGAHVEFLRGVLNPIGLKVGPSIDGAELEALCETLNPDRVSGRLTLICRFGADSIADKLPPILERISATGHPVVWASDPMHGNTFSSGGVKTRSFDAIVRELQSFFTICRSNDVWPGGVHLELTGENVTECLGGGDAIDEGDLQRRYESICDPRLNASQAIDLAFSVAELLRA
jgi:3-deoxy-7-phosphoheptulonate synthase